MGALYGELRFRLRSNVSDNPPALGAETPEHLVSWWEKQASQQGTFNSL